MVVIKHNSGAIAAQRARIAGIRGGFEKAVTRAAKRVADQGRTQISKEIRQNLNIKAGDLKPVLKTKGFKGGATIRLNKSERLSLRHFGAKQNAKGVSYKINKSGGRTFVAGAFQGPKPGAMKISWKGSVFKRVGKSRLPIVKLQGASAWGVFVVKKMYDPTRKDLQQKFHDRLSHEISFLIAKGATRRA